MCNQVLELLSVLDTHGDSGFSIQYSRETSLSITKLQEGVMWLGMNLKRLGAINPYPSSKDPSTGSIVEPTADGMKL